MAKEEVPEKKENEKEETKETPGAEEKQAKTRQTSRGIIYAVIAVVFLAIGFLVGGVVMQPPTGLVVSDLAMQEAAESAVDYINNYIPLDGATASLISVEKTDYPDLFNVKMDIGGRPYDSYVTTDGRLFFPSFIDLEQTPEVPQQQEQPAGVPKSDKPEVELFVMTHCPYGTQAEKAIIPAIQTLGDKIDAKIMFVHYFMHAPEETETPVQVCIREEHPDKFLDYLECFLEDGDSARCLDETELNVDSCVENNADGYYEDDAYLSQGYGVGGSPTLVINGVITNFNRSPAGALSVICSAFNTPPEECGQALSAATASPGFGAGTGGSSGGQC